MASLDERVALLERRMEDHTAVLTDLRSDVRGLRAEMTGLRAEMDRRFERVDQRFDRMDQKIDRHFMWLVGMFATLLVALLGLSLQVARLQSL